jgi:cytochrome c-type biogenesis protein CcmE
MKKTHILAIVFIGVAIAAIITTFSDTSTYVSFQQARAYPEKDFHVIGTLDKDRQLMYNPVKDPNFFRFHLQDETGESHPVVYYDAKPQDFEKSDKVVVVGQMEDEYFHAKKILMKCPSKYQEEGEFKEAPRSTASR